MRDGDGGRPARYRQLQDDEVVAADGPGMPDPGAPPWLVGWVRTDRYRSGSGALPDRPDLGGVQAGGSEPLTGRSDGYAGDPEGVPWVPCPIVIARPATPE